MFNITKIQIIWIIILIALILLSFFGVTDKALNGAFRGWDTKTDEHLTELSIKAGASYGIARGLNAIISVVQETEISVIVATVSVGQVLDPINDLVEKLSTIMLISLSSLGLQLLIHRIGIALGVRWFLSFGFLFLFIKMIPVWFPGVLEKFDRNSSISNFLKKLFGISESLSIILFVAFILIRFMIPAVAFVSLSTEDIIMQNYEEATSSLAAIEEETKSEYEEIQNEVEDEEERQNEVVEESTVETIQLEDKSESETETGFFTSLLDKAKDVSGSLVDTVSESTIGKSIINTASKISSSISTLNIKEKIDGLINSLSGSITHITDLIIIFIVQTVILPLVTLWGLKALTLPIIKELLK
jgi:low affinity Fe/Cu permease